MAKSKKNRLPKMKAQLAKLGKELQANGVIEADVVVGLRATEQSLNETQIPEALQERFNSQIENVCKRIGKIADNLQKAIILEVTKDEREAKKAERITKRRETLEAQLTAVQAKLAKLDS